MDVNGPEPASSSKGMGPADKGRNFKYRSKEYILRRQRNNIAVRKSREKAKQYFYSLQEREKELEENNWKLEVKIDTLTRQVRKLREIYEQLKESGYIKPDPKVEQIASRG